jgi:hypothetical protein
MKCSRTEMAFGLAIAEIRRGLERVGRYLAGRGQKGAQFVIAPANTNAGQMDSYQRQAFDKMKRAVILGTNTPREELNQEEQKALEGRLERIATRLALMGRRPVQPRIENGNKP